MPGCEARHINRDITQAVEEEDHAEQKQQMIVAGDHVFRAQVQKWSDVRAGDGLKEVGVASGDAVSQPELTRGEKK
jgi:hypothetical protein